MPDAKFDEAITPARLLKSDKEATILSPSEQRASTAANEMALQQTEDLGGDSDSVVSSENSVKYDPQKIRNYINRINKINQKQTEQAFKETQRNRKISSIGSIHNITIGQAYYNLNKTTQPGFQGFGTRKSYMAKQRERGSFFQPGFPRTANAPPRHGGSFSVNLNETNRGRQLFS